jgi:hypothetical protein
MATTEEVTAAALQFVRKISGTRKPSKANQDAFERAVREIADSGERLLKAMAENHIRGARAEHGRVEATRPPLAGEHSRDVME